MTAMPFIENDGGRAAAGFKGRAGDCVARSIAIATNLPYSTVYADLARGTGSQRATKRKGKRAASARNGINTKRKWFKDYMASLGFTWTPTMHIGSGCKVHLAKGELPETGRLVVSVSGQYTAVLNGIIFDTYDPQRHTVEYGDKDGTPFHREYDRCVYGYWTLAPGRAA